MAWHRPRLPAAVVPVAVLPDMLPPPPLADGEERGPPTPRMAELDHALVNAARAESQEALRQITAAARERPPERTPLPGDTPAELAGPLALMAMRLLELRMHDVDPRIAMEAARCVVAGAPKVRELTSVGSSDAVDPEARRAALVAALTSDEAVALVVDLACGEGGPVRAALEAAGWRGPESAEGD